MRDLVIERLLEDKREHAKRVWHWGKDKLRMQELALRIEFDRLTDEQLLEKYEKVLETIIVNNWRDYV